MNDAVKPTSSAKAGPISPDEAESGEHIPAEVFEAFNELIREGRGTVRQRAAVERITQKMQAKDPGFDSKEVYRKGWLDVEGAYRKKGWSVDYDKPGYNESYEAFFEFRRRR